MLFSNFNTQTSGRITLGLFPNGIHTDNGAISCKFSLLTGIFLQGQPKQDPYDIDGPDDLIFSFMDEVNRITKNLSWQGPHSGPVPLFETGAEIFDGHCRKKWEKLLGGDDVSSFVSRGNTDTNAARRKDAKPFYDEDEHLNNLPYSSLNSLQYFDGTRSAEEHIADNYYASGQKVLGRDYKYNQIKAQGRHHSQHMSTGVTNDKFLNGKRKIDLLQLMNAFYVLPEIAREFGLIHDFTIPVSDKRIGSLYLGKPDADIQKFALQLYVSAPAGKENFFGYPDPAIPNLLSSFNTGTRNINNKKYYHGSSEYGLTSVKNLKYFFTTMSPDHKKQNEHQSNSAYQQAAQKQERIVDFADHKQPVTQGIYMIQATPDLGTSVNKIGINDHGFLGQNIAVAIDSKEDADCLYSLCSRMFHHKLSGALLGQEKPEEGWLHTQARLNGLTEDFNAQTIFHWTGHNLCISKPKPSNPDQVVKGAVPDGQGGLQDLFEHGENDLLRDRGFTYHYDINWQSEAFLADRFAYHFLIREVVSNGFTIGLHHTKEDGRENEITVEDLLADACLSDKWFTFSEGTENIFNLDRDPVPAPMMLANRHFLSADPDSTESETFIALGGEGDHAIRSLYPPMIDFQFACLLGLLTPERLNTHTIDEYKIAAGKLLRRATKTKLDKKEFDRPMNYLADTRGRSLQFSAANWFTRNAMANIFTAPEVYRYADSGDPYHEVEHQELRIKAGGALLGGGIKVTWPGAPSAIELELAEGLECSFSLRFTGTGKEVFPAHLQTITTKNRELVTQKFLAPSELSHPAYPISVFQVSNIPIHAGPGFTVQADPASVGRGNALSDQSKLFYSFTATGLLLNALKTLSMRTRYTVMQDNGEWIPERKILEAAAAQWSATPSNGPLLTGEFPASIFNQTIQNLEEPEIYKNHFGVHFSFTPALITAMIAGDMLWTLHIGQKTDLILNMRDSATATLSVVNGSDPSNRQSPRPGVAFPVIVFGNEYRIVVNFSYSGVLKMSVSVNETEYHLFVNDYPYSDLPYSDMSWKHLELSSSVEAVYLGPDTKSVFEFQDSAEFFVYRTERGLQFVDKQFEIVALSKYMEIYPKEKKEKCLLHAPMFSLAVPANQIPVTPRFSITPLIMQDLSADDAGFHKKRSMQIMFEIDRPLDNNEKFALVLEDLSGNGASTCDIGRDMTTWGPDFNETFYQFIDRKNEGHPYLKKYLFQGGDKTTVNIASGDSYSVLILEPFFEITKQKWISVIAFTDFAFTGNVPTPGHAAYNPFIKIVGAIYQEHATEGKHISALTEPKFMNILSPRRVSLLLIKAVVLVKPAGSDGPLSRSKHEHFWKLSIDNSDQIKRNSDNSPRSRFLVTLREKNRRGILGDITPSCKVYAESGNWVLDETEVKWHITSEPDIYLKRQHHKVVCIYEFEMFDNTVEPVDADDDWLSNPSFRLVYAEEFT